MGNNTLIVNKKQTEYPKLSMNIGKTFTSYNSLKYEKNRLDTFIEWPITWLKPTELAAAGFYYLRTSDHCACVFCRGIVGGWETGDTPQNEHQRHFPHCPYIRGQPVGNIPIDQGQILSNLTPTPVYTDTSKYVVVVIIVTMK